MRELCAVITVAVAEAFFHALAMTQDEVGLGAILALTLLLIVVGFFIIVKRK